MSPRPGRRRCVGVLAVWLCVVGVPGCGGHVPPLPRLTPGDTVLAFGDSLTAGTGAEPHEAYPVVLSGLIGRRVVAAGVDSAVTAANLRAMVQLARDRGVPVVLIGLPKPPLFPGSVEHYAAIAGEFDLPFESDILRALLFDASTRSDMIHPNAVGYRRMSEAIAALLRDAGAIE